VQTTIPSPLGNLTLTFTNQKLTHLTLAPDNTPLTPINELYIITVTQALTHYFTNPHHPFHIDFRLHGTTFQLRVWQALQSIPPGQTLTYGALAKQLQSSPRAIGQACRTNPIPIIIPCHRIVAMNGIGGYAGETAGKLLEMKNWLLRHEK
jgi:methylated-DNA-[protein]-cysteine S-methyltransferase